MFSRSFCYWATGTTWTGAITPWVTGACPWSGINSSPLAITPFWNGPTPIVKQEVLFAPVAPGTTDQAVAAMRCFMPMSSARSTRLSSFGQPLLALHDALAVDVATNEPPPEIACGNRRGKSATAWIDYELARFRKILDETFNFCERFLPFVPVLFSFVAEKVRPPASFFPVAVGANEDRSPVVGHIDRMHPVGTTCPDRGHRPTIG